MARSRPRQARQAERLILDSGAVIALSRADQRARAFLARALELGATIEVPVAVIAETVRGDPRDSPVHRILKRIDAVPATTEAMGRIAGELLGKAGSASTVDALVVAQAVQGGRAIILTSDPDDLERLAAPHPKVIIRSL